MRVYRIVRSIERTNDFSGTGAFRAGGRWNDKGNYVLYTSENSSLAFLENLVHFEQEEIPEQLYIVEIEFEVNDRLVYSLADSDYPVDWKIPDNLACKQIGNVIFTAKNYLVLKVKSAVNPAEFNYLFNPIFPNFHDLLRVSKVEKIPVDSRLL